MDFLHTLFLVTLSLSGFNSEKSFLQNSDPAGGGAYEIEAPTQCISPQHRAEIVLNLEKSRKELIDAGKLNAFPNRQNTVSFGQPIRAADHMPSNIRNFYGISNYLDQNTSSPNILDYNCGSTTYDGHNGTDYFSWPFPWHMVENDLVEIIASAPGTIIYKEEGQDDDHCSFVGSWNAVYIEHNDGSIAWYGHLKKNSLTSKAVGDNVSQGEYLGIMASSGWSTGPHLHLEIYEQLPYTRSNLIDPYTGSCNSLNSDSWWEDQQDYNEPTLNAVVTHDAPPIFGCPGPYETPNMADTFYVGMQVITAFYYRDQYTSSISNFRLLRPDNSTYLSWSHSSPNSYNGSYWYWTRNLPSNGPFGNWQLEGVYEGDTVRHTFKYLPAACQNPIKNEYSGPNNGLWGVASHWSRGHVPLFCEEVVIPDGLRVLLPAGASGECYTLEVEVGGDLDISPTAELHVLTEY